MMNVGRIAVVAAGVLCVAPAMALPLPMSAAQQQDAESAAEPAADAILREQAQGELTRIDVAFRIDGDAGAARQALTQLMASDPRTAALIEADGALRTARDLLQDALDGAVAPGDASVDDVVREAARRNDTATLEKLGTRALDVIEQQLASLIQAEGPNDSERLLGILIQLSPKRAVVFLQRHGVIDRLGARRILSAIQQSSVLQRHWSNVPGSKPQFMFPELLDLMVVTLHGVGPEERDEVCEAMSALSAYIGSRDAFSPELAKALGLLLLQSERKQAFAVLNSIDDRMQWPSVQPLYEALLSHRDAIVRADAADRVSCYRDSRALRDCIADPSPTVRMRLAKLLSPKDIRVPTWPQRNSAAQPDVQYVVPDNDEEQRTLLVTLSQDDDPQVREAAVRSLGQLRAPAVERSVLERLAQDPDRGVRYVLATILHPENEADAELMCQIVRTGDRMLFEGMHSMLWDAAHKSENVKPIVSILRAMPSSESQVQTLQGIGSVLARESAAGRNALTRWTLETGDPRPLDVAIAPTQVSNENDYQSQLVKGWLELSPDELTRLYPILAATRSAPFSWLAHRLHSRPSPALAQAMRPLFEDAAQPPLLRLAAAVLASTSLDSALERELLDFVGNPILATLDPRRDVTMLLGELGEAFPETERNRVLMRVLTETALPDELLLNFIASYSPYAPDGQALTEAILQRWVESENGEAESMLRKALEHAGSLRGKLDPQLLLRGSRNARVAATAVKAMGRQRDPVFLSMLAECLDANWLGEDTREQVSAYAVTALTGYMSDDAARILLQAAAEASDAFLRDQCLEAVDTIRKYQDALSDWQRRGTSRTTRDVAVSSLVAMLDDPSPEVRAEALRGLVSLRAVEYLPRIIQGLKDEDQAVRQAARAALDRNHQLEAEEDRANQPVLTSPTESSQDKGGG